MENFLHILKNSLLFADIEEKQLPELLNCLQAVTVSYGKNDNIFFAGNPATNVGIVCKGKAQVVKEDIMGNRTILANLSAGDLFGETFACAKIDILPVSVVAVIDCIILLMDYRKVITTCPASCFFHNKLIENMLHILAQKNLLLNQKIQVLSSRGMRAKLISYLLAEADKNSSTSFHIPFDRQQLADYLSVDRSALSSELGRMRDEGLLKFDKNQFQLLVTDKQIW